MGLIHGLGTKILHALGQLSPAKEPCAATTEPALHNWRSPHTPQDPVQPKERNKKKTHQNKKKPQGEMNKSFIIVGY